MSAVSNLNPSIYTRQKFEPEQTKPGFPQIHLDNINKATFALSQVVDASHSSDLRDLQESLPKLVDVIGLDTSVYQEKGANKNDVGKYLISSLALPGGKDLCLQLLYFKPRQKTIVHDHACNCAFTVVEGEARNRLYSENEKDGSIAKILPSQDYQKGDLAKVNLDETNIHSLKNKSSSSDLITLHLYEVNGVENQSVKRTF